MSSINESNSSREPAGWLFAMGQASPLFKDNPTLTQQEVDILRQQLCYRPADRFTWRKLFGKHWDSFKASRLFGKRAKRAVLSGLLPELQLCRKKLRTSLQYEMVSSTATDSLTPLAA